MGEKKDSKLMNVLKNFAVGGLSGMSATCCTQPVDFTKVQIQLASKNGLSTSPFVNASKIYKSGGVKAFYSGIDSALLRQAIYCSGRIGLYFVLTDMIRERNNGKLPGIHKLSCSFISGAIGSFIANPCDLALVRMQADKALPMEERRNYKNVLDAFSRIVKEEGVMACWNGAGPTVARAVAMNVSMMATYDEAKERITHMMPNSNMRLIQLLSSCCAGVACAVCSLPPDNIKTKLQNMPLQEDGTYPYKGFMHCAIMTAKTEGVLAYWVGLPTYIFRVGPHAFITLLIAEKLKAVFGL